MTKDERINVAFLKELTNGQRALLAAAITGRYKESRLEWLSEARKTFYPQNRTSCVICGKYLQLCHAHHVMPLFLQWELGVAEPLHEYQWLCPTHHELAHRHIHALVANKWCTVDDVPLVEKEAMQSILSRFVEVYLATKGERENRC